MKFTLPLLQLAALSAAFTLPDQDIFQELELETAPTRHDLKQTFSGLLRDLEDTFESTAEEAHHWFTETKSSVSHKAHDISQQLHGEVFTAQSWIDSAVEDARHRVDELTSVFDDDETDERPPHHRRPGHGHHKPNKTVYELIAGSKYTTKLAKLINDYPDLVEALNGTAANYTVFAPTDRAFEKIPEHHKKPTKEQIKKLLTYHVSSDFYPAGRVLVSRTIPTLLKSAELGQGNPQRLTTKVGLRGLTVNFYSRIIAIDIFGTNGVIHGVDSLIIPPPETLKIIELLPSEFSTLTLGLEKTGLIDALNKTHSNGGTFFAPSNFAFKKLGPGINAFLFSPRGEKYLKALLKYHVVPDQTLYSDAYYGPKKDKSSTKTVPRGYFHYDLPTLLEDKSLSVDVGRYGRLIEIKINGFSRVSVSDGVAKDGVIHGVGSVLIPPRTASSGEQEMADPDAEMSEEELIERLEPYVDTHTDL